MSVKFSSRVWEFSHSTGTDRLVLLALADNADDNGECWPSIRHLARKCRIDTRTVQRHIRSLELLGEVRVIVGGGRSRMAGGTRSNRYQIVIHIPDDDEGGNLPPGGRGARGWVAALPGGGVAALPPEASLEPSMNSLASKNDASGFSSIREAVIEVCGLSTENITSSADGALASAVKNLVDVGASTNDVNLKASIFRQRYPHASLTPNALAKHWPTLQSNVVGSTAPRISKEKKLGITIARTTTDAAEALAQITDALWGDQEAIAAAMSAWETTIGSAVRIEPEEQDHLTTAMANLLQRSE